MRGGRIAGGENVCVTMSAAEVELVNKPRRRRWKGSREAYMRNKILHSLLISPKHSWSPSSKLHSIK